MILSSIYEFLLIASIIITFVFGLVFLSIKFPVSKELYSYRIFRIVMALAYLSFCVAKIIEILIPDINIRLMRCLVLSANSLQAFLYTYSFIILINPSFISCKRIFFNLLNILIISSLVFIAYFLPGINQYFDEVFLLTTIYYIVLLFSYILLFRRIYTCYLFNVDNYYSELELARMRWVLVSFIASMFIGIVALVSVTFPSMITTIILNIYICIFYSFYGIRYINYVFQFRFLQPVLIYEKAINELTDCEDKNTDTSDIEMSLRKWVGEEMFIQPNITIEQVARQLQTNRTYLSLYINKVENKTFREWINRLRIEKAKKILLLHSDISITEIAFLIGYNDCSNFNKQFVKYVGVSAQIWRKQHM